MERKAFKLARRPDTSIISWLPLHNNNASHHYWFGAKGFDDWEAAAAARLVGWPQHPSIVSGWSINNIFPFSSIVRNSHYSKSQIHWYTLSFHNARAAEVTRPRSSVQSSKETAIGAARRKNVCRWAGPSETLVIWAKVAINATD